MEPVSSVPQEIANVKTMEDVRARGRETLYQNLDKAINFVAPLADPEGLYKIGSERVQKATTEILTEISQGVDDCVDAFIIQPYEKTKAYAENQAQVFLKWSAGLALSGGGVVESALQKVSAGIDEVREWKANKAEKKANKIEDKAKKAREKATAHRQTVTETRESTKKMTTIREMAANLKA